MYRSQFLAAIVLLAVIVGLFASRLGSGSDEQTASASSDAGDSDLIENEQPTPITGGESAVARPAGADTASNGEAGSPATTVTVTEAPPLLGEKPGLDNLDGWLQTDAQEFEAFDGQVRIVQFWTFGCHNCKATIPHLQDIYADWHDDGLEIIGVHAPEFSYEADHGNIANAAVDLGVTWPIALDTEKKNFRSWQEKRRFWPRTYVLDQNGQVRFDRIGEGQYQELADTVAYLIENGP
ncbi:MAG: redoxin domain-containing protein [Acidimicrobiales bacterium]